MEIHHYQSAYSFLHLEAPAAARPLITEHIHTFRTLRSGSAHPNNAVLRIPSLLTYSFSLVYQSYSLQDTQ